MKLNYKKCNVLRGDMIEHYVMHSVKDRFDETLWQFVWISTRSKVWQPIRRSVWLRIHNLIWHSLCIYSEENLPYSRGL